VKVGKEDVFNLETESGGFFQVPVDISLWIHNNACSGFLITQLSTRRGRDSPGSIAQGS